MVRDCPERKNSGKFSVKDGSLLFVGAALDNLIATSNDFTSRSVDGVWGIMDTGAARSLGGARSLENAAIELCDLDGHDDTKVDPKSRPSFTFGNGERKSACSTVTMKIVWGDGRRATDFAVMDVDVPILLGQDVLAADDVFDHSRHIGQR